MTTAMAMTLIDRRRVLGLLICFAAVCVPMPAASTGVKVTEIPQRSRNDKRTDALTYQVAIMRDAGWQLEDVERAIDQTEAIYAQCGVRVVATAVCWLETPDALKELEESQQATLLSKLPRQRPLAVFVDQTKARDTAYSYLLSAPVASKGTAWITRKSGPSCVGPLLAHELGHILLNTADHSADPGNLMAYTCTHSNINRSMPNTQLSKDQCKRLRALR